MRPMLDMSQRGRATEWFTSQHVQHTRFAKPQLRTPQLSRLHLTYLWALLVHRAGQQLVKVERPPALSQALQCGAELEGYATLLLACSEGCEQ